MLGASRTSLETVREVLANNPGDAELGEELLVIATLLASESTLRGSLGDPGSAAAQRIAIVDSLLAGKVSTVALNLAKEVVSRRWSSGRDLVEAFGTLGAEALFIQAEADGRLDAVQNQLFDFSRAVAANGELQLVLGNPAVPGAERSAVVGSLVEGRVEPETFVLLKDAVSNPRGRRLDDALTELVALAAVRRRELLAQVRAAVELSNEQSERLATALARVYGQPVQVQQILDPTVVGGVSVTINDEVIDGTTVHRLEQARRLLVGGQA